MLAVAAFAQAPVVGDINLYGLHKLSPDKVLHALGLTAGEPLTASRGGLEDRLEELPGVVRAQVQAVCCEDKRAMIFVGIEEKGAPHLALRSEPAGEAVLQQSLADLYRDFLDKVQAAARGGSTSEDLSQGHALMADPDVRAVQLHFAEYAAANLPNLREVLRNGSDPDQRAIAATVIGYAPRKAEVVNDLQYALQDPDEAVRANAIRSLTAIAVLAALHPGSGIKISPTWFVELLQSVVLSDRVKSAEALVTLTEHADPGVLDLLRERALPSLAEMARWKTLGYALPAYVLLGRVAGMPEAEIHAAWEKGQRESVIARALGEPVRAKKR